MNIENNIVYDAYYLINKFNKSGKDVTNMHIQKLMYFFESYYMSIHNDLDKLYECDFEAWHSGPVAIPLYKEFRCFGKSPIRLTQDMIDKGNSISTEKKRLLDNLYECFKDFSVSQLENITHMEKGPWSEVWYRIGKKIGYDDDDSIDKIQTRDWFVAEIVQ